MQQPDRVGTCLDGGVVYAAQLRLDVDRRRADGREVRERVCVGGGRRFCAGGSGTEGLQVKCVGREDGAGNEGVRVRVDDRDGECDAGGGECLRFERT